MGDVGPKASSAKFSGSNPGARGFGSKTRHFQGFRDLCQATRARIVYHLLKYQVPFSALPPAQEDARYRERALRNLRQKALKLGARIVVDLPTDTQTPGLVS